METDFVKQKSVELSLGTLRILANKLGVHARLLNPSLIDARRFAETLILVEDVEPARKLILSDQEGARAFLGLAEDEDISRAYESVELGSGDQPIYLTFAPVSMWILAVIQRRRMADN